MKTIHHFVDGKGFSGDSKRLGKVFNPATGEQSAEVKMASNKDVNDAVANAKSQTLDSLKDGQRDGIIGPRKKGKIGFSVIRGGDIVGNHSVIFAGQGEQITITHNATDRMIFARGAIKAAKWGMTAPNGAYSMKDVLKLN